MAAVLTPQALPHEGRRPGLVVIQGGRSGSARSRKALYRRRRILVSVLAIGVVAASWSLLGSLVSPGAGEPTVVRHAVGQDGRYVVRSGDTLWEVARGLGSGGDLRDVVEQLAEANGTDALTPGQVLVIPAALR